MIDVHLRHGDVKGAVGLFWEAPEINIVSWTTMIAGFARNAHGKEALLYFVNMLRNLQIPDDITFGAVLLACATLTVLRNGLMVHGCLVCHGFESFVYVANGLVNMYAKCGDIKSSCKVFDEIIAKDLVSWNAVIFGLAVHGWAQKALKVFEDMISDRVQPDKLTFLGLLMACCHSGLVEQGMGFLSSMNSVHQISPDADHVTCVIDMLGRAGRLREAAILLDYFSDSVKDKHAGYWESLLCASIIHQDVNLAMAIGEQFMNLEPQMETSYVLLSNLYCFSGHWKEAENIRRAMADRALRDITSKQQQSYDRAELQIYIVWAVPVRTGISTGRSHGWLQARRYLTRVSADRRREELRPFRRQTKPRRCSLMRIIHSTFGQFLG
ncbi:hypothetical protein HPP92_002924 [Vanilla planifolia]|uniref:Pentatricopeptide repeat-containing protein n=1 Tax=Vanilla planifolia TaxID=51239 RepID=A0A835VL09_VANPL|nr:hypothetical protein HPP92_002924 [Vanilla planifolia]